jgi:hypothetical protein
VAGDSTTVGLSSIVDALKDTSGKRINSFIARQVGSFIPAGVANIAAGLDRTVRHPDGIIETLESRTPGLTGNVPPSLEGQRTQFQQWEREHLRSRMAAVVGTAFWSKLPDTRKIVAIKQWLEALDRSRPVRVARMRQGD